MSALFIRRFSIFIVAFGLTLGLFFALTAWANAATYYVDNCDVTGNDTNNGTSVSTPWLTINKVNTSSFNPGDSISFRKGCTWREQLTVPSPGSAVSPITFGSYGETGAKPIISGSKLASASGDWIQESATVTNWLAGMEGNNFSEWTTETDPNNVVSVSSTRAHTGTYSALIDDVTFHTGQLLKSGIGAIPNATVSFWLNFNGTTLDTDHYIQRAVGDARSTIQLRYSSPNFTVRVSIVDDSDAETYTSTYNITATQNTWHKIALVFTTNASNGGVQLLIDDVSKETISGKATTLATVDRMWVTNYAESIYYDDFAVTNTGGDTNLWYTSASATPSVVWKDGVRMTKVTNKTDIGTNATKWWWDSSNSRVYVYSGGSAPTGSYDIAQRNSCITATDKSFITIDGVTCEYVNQSLIYPTRSAGNSTNWTVQNATLLGAYRSAIEAVGTAANQYDYLTVSANAISDFGGDISYPRDGIRIGYGDHLIIANNTVTMSDFANNGWAGAVHYFHSTALDTDSAIYGNSISGTEKTNFTAGVFLEDVSYLDIYQNIITANVSNSLWMDESGGGTGDGPDHNNVYRNLIQMTGDYNGVGMLVENSPNNNFFNNVIFGTEDATSFNKGMWIRSSTGGNSDNATIYNNSVVVPIGGNALQVGWSSDSVSTLNATVKNNIFYKSSGVNLIVVDDAPVRRADEHFHIFNNNVWWNGPSNQVVGWFNTFYATQAAFKSGTNGAGANQVSGGHEASGLEVDPLFTNSSSFDFTLAAGSPAINNGANLGSTYQLALDPDSVWPGSVLTLNQNSYGSGWEIGAYVYDTAAPVASAVLLNSGGAITLTESTTTNITVTGTVTDDNSCKDLTSVKVVIYKQGTTCAASGDADNDNCYFYEDTNPANDVSCTDISDTTYDANKTFAVQYYADPGTWVGKVIPADGEGPGTSDTDNQTLNELQSLNVSTAIDYGSVSAGSNSTGDHTATVTNTGNMAIDVNISGTAMSCTIRGSIPVGNQEYSLSTFNYGAGTDLTATSTPWNLILGIPDETPITDTTYWQVGVPVGTEGTCSGTDTFTARLEL